MVTICRICEIELQNSTDLVNLYNSKFTLDNGSLMPFDEIYEAITDIQINETDGLPSYICNICARKLIDAYTLKLQATETHKRLVLKKLCPKNTNKYTTEAEEVYIEVTEIPNDNVATEEVIRNETPAIEAIVEEQEHAKTPTPPLTTEVDHQCKVCTKVFARKSNLIDHLRIHAKIRPYRCEHCDRTFVQLCNYRTHLRTHFNERPYQCQYCAKTYTQSNALKIHIRSHTNERIHHCTVCEKGFTNTSDLAKHKRVHDPSTHFKCDVCLRTFSQKVNMEVHKRRRHPETKLISK